MKKSDLKTIIKEVISEAFSTYIVFEFDGSKAPPYPDKIVELAVKNRIQTRLLNSPNTGPVKQEHSNVYQIMIRSSDKDDFVRILKQLRISEYKILAPKQASTPTRENSDITEQNIVSEMGQGGEWKRAAIHNVSGDTEQAWRTFGTKESNGNSELERVFYTAISVAEENENHVGSYTSNKFIVEVDLDKKTYRIESLQKSKKTKI